MERLWMFARRHRGRWLWGGLLLLLTNAASMSIPQIFRFSIDAINGGAGLETLRDLALTLMLVAGCGAVFRVLSRIHIFFAARDVEMDLRCAYYAHLTELEPSFFESRSTGDLISRATNDLTQVRLLLGPGVLNLVNTSIAYATAIPLMMLVSVKLTLLTLLVYPPSLLLMRRLAKALYTRNRAQQDAAGAIAAHVQEDLAGAHVVRAFGVEASRKALFDRSSDAYYEASVHLAWVRSGMFRLVMGIANTTVLVAVYLGARDAVAGTLTLGEVVAAAEYMAILAWPTFALGWVASVWQRGAASMSRLSEVLDTKPEIHSGPTLPPEMLEPTLKVNKLCVRLGDRLVLNGVDVDVPAGCTLGVVGPIGSGKTTFVRAMMRLVKIADGTIEVGGHEVRTLDLGALRRAFGFVPQTPGLFSKSLAENVAFGMPAAQTSMIREALTLASFHTDLEVLPNGMDTPVGERGIALSGGQKQRTAIARALLLDPPVLILDDALSAVDGETESAILGHLRRLRQRRTTVIVAHRISAVAHADEIIVLDEGRVRERGTHAQLLAESGLYASMVQRQAEQKPGADVEDVA